KVRRVERVADHVALSLVAYAQRFEVRRRCREPGRRAELKRRRSADVVDVVDEGDRPRELGPGDGGPEPPAGDAEGFREPHDADRWVAEAVDGGWREVGATVVAEVLVDLVGDDQKVVFARHPGDDLELLAREHLAAGIAW